MFKGEGALAYT
jgi:hypothetical protein